MKRAITLVACCASGLAMFAVSCTAQAPVPPDQAFEYAIDRARASDDQGAITALRIALEADSIAYQRALLEPTFYSGLRDTPAYREVVHEAALAHGVSYLQLVPDDEPGEWIVVEGLVVDPAGTALPGAIVTLFATDAEGRYHPEIEGERTARSFGTLVADAEGRFMFKTVRPGPYPGTRNARHIHISARADGLRLARPGYAVFDDDPLLYEPQSAEQRGEAIRIVMQAANGQAHGTMVLPMR